MIGNIVSETDKNNNLLVRYIRDIGGKAISMIQGANTYYFVYNGHGDVTALTDGSGAIAATYSYDEFGNLTTDDRQPTTGQIYNPLRYSGANNAYYDTETGLYKMGARYYQPDVGRWLTRDEYLGQQENAQSINRYVYVENNPINGVDPTGYWKFWFHANMAKTAAKKLHFSDFLTEYLQKGVKGIDFDTTMGPFVSTGFKFHFNMWDKKVKAYRSKAPWRYYTYREGDSRVYYGNVYLNSAIEGKTNNNISGPAKWSGIGIKLGYGLHMIQDIYAHLNASPKMHWDGPNSENYDKPSWRKWRSKRTKQATYRYLKDFKNGVKH